jgi:hypothetical protein
MEAWVEMSFIGAYPEPSSSMGSLSTGEPILTLLPRWDFFRQGAYLNTMPLPGWSLSLQGAYLKAPPSMGGVGEGDAPGWYPLTPTLSHQGRGRKIEVTSPAEESGND